MERKTEAQEERLHHEKDEFGGLVFEHLSRHTMKGWFLTASES